MPNPLRRWVPIEFNADALEQRPKLAVAIARVSTEWADIEVELGLLLGTMLHTGARTGVAMYLALRGSGTIREDVLIAAAAKTLPKNMQLELEVLLDQVGKRGKERNKVVHCLWGTSPKFVDALINCPPDNLVQEVYSADGLVRVSELTEFNPGPDFVGNLMVYKAKCFAAIHSRLSTTVSHLRTFNEKVAAFQDRKP
jgi:hypothetical protein